MILIIENNPLSLELVTDLLEAAGYDVLQASTAEEGIRLANAELPHLILMDLSLPGMDGLRATKILKKSPSTMDIPVIALTAQAMKGDEQKVLAAGCDGYITKPINTRKFLKDVDRFFSIESQD